MDSFFLIIITVSPGVGLLCDVRMEDDITQNDVQTKRSNELNKGYNGRIKRFNTHSDWRAFFPPEFVVSNTGRNCFFKTTGMTIPYPSLSQLAVNNNNNLISLGPDEYLLISFLSFFGGEYIRRPF